MLSTPRPMHQFLLPLPSPQPPCPPSHRLPLTPTLALPPCPLPRSGPLAPPAPRAPQREARATSFPQAHPPRQSLGSPSWLSPQVSSQPALLLASSPPAPVLPAADTSRRHQRTFMHALTPVLHTQKGRTHGFLHLKSEHVYTCVNKRAVT